MKVQVANYWTRCGADGRGCEIEELVDDTSSPHQIVGPGRVLSKCANHADVSDGDLWAVMQDEGRRIREAREGLGEEQGALMRYKFEGQGYERRLKILP